jgi:serine/threonine protein kinase
VAGTKTAEASKIYGGGLLGPFYCAPEIFDNQYPDVVDEYSIGVIMYYLLVGEVPINDNWDYESTIRLI